LEVLSACRIYTKPLLLLKKLRTIWEMENRANSDWTTLYENHPSQLPHEFGTIRRNSSKNRSTIRRKNRIPSEDSAIARRESEVKYFSEFDSILDQIDQLTDKLDSEVFMDEFALELKSADTEFDDRNSRDSGIASSYCSDWTESIPEPENTTAVQRRIARLLQQWVKNSPNAFFDQIVQKSLSSFLRFLSANRCISMCDSTKLIRDLDTQSHFAFQFCQKIQRNRFPNSANLR